MATLGTASLGSLLYNKADAVILGYLVPAAALGLYSAAYKIFEVGLSAVGLVHQALFPGLASAALEPRRLAGAARQYTAIQAVVTLPGAAATAILAESALRMLCGEAYVGAAPVLRVLALGLPAAALASLMAGGFLMLARQSALYAAVVWGSGILNVAINLWLIPVFGPIIAAGTTVLSQAGVGLAAAALRKKDVSMSFLRAAAVPAAWALGLAAMLGLSRSVLSAGRWSDAGLLAFAAVCCGGGLWGVLSFETKKAMGEA
jgi:O-antigen/teichoic acid export membrane protein